MAACVAVPLCVFSWSARAHAPPTKRRAGLVCFLCANREWGCPALFLMNASHYLGSLAQHMNARSMSPLTLLLALASGARFAPGWNGEAQRPPLVNPMFKLLTSPFSLTSVGLSLTANSRAPWAGLALLECIWRANLPASDRASCRSCRCIQSNRVGQGACEPLQPWILQCGHR